MGSLQRFDLRKYAEQYRLSAFFETGTFRGDGIQQALASSFDQIFSVEIVEEFHDAVVARFEKHREVSLILGDSAATLARVLPTIEGNIFFWLDAHFPGADGGLQDFNSLENDTVRLPLESELRTIKRFREGRKDVILIDDLRIYEVGEYERGNLPPEIKPPAVAGIDFIFDLFAETHHILRLNYDEGYVLLVPNTISPAINVRKTFSEVGIHRPAGKHAFLQKLKNSLNVLKARILRK